LPIERIENIMSEKNNRGRERRLRRQAKGMGFILSKSKIGVGTIDNMGLYRIVDVQMNTIEAGEKYDLTLDDVEKFLAG
jgi:hypothetical protein